jgi:hypothetical protein
MVLLTLPEIIALACFLLLVLVMYGVIGIHLFAGVDKECYQSTIPNSDSEGDEYENEEEFPRYIKRSFEDLGNALIALYVLSTSENYPLVMYPMYDCHRHSEEQKLYSLYFVSFLTIILFGINVLSVPMLYAGLVKHLKADAYAGRILERTALHAAFELLDVSVVARCRQCVTIFCSCR